MRMTDRPEQQEEVFELPLFPLNLVLFPGMMLPLHIFEERYQEMIGDCARDKKPFGVILIRDGEEVGGSAVPVDVGTTARIVDVQALGDGRMNILTRGDRRFKVHKITQETPYLVAQVSYLSDEAGPSAESLMEEIRAKYNRLLGRMETVSDSPGGDAHVPSEPAALSFTIAAKLASCVQLPTTIRQEWLECESVHRRLVELGELVDRVNGLLEAELLKTRKKDRYLN
jgi:Lon protease-like protein